MKENIKGSERKYHYFYKITNLINEHFYYGVHNTDNLNDGYMGSGTRLRYAYKKYGIEHFKKEILKFFDTSKEAFEYEAEIVNEELIHDSNCYNISCGGSGWNTLGTVTVKDKDGHTSRVDINDQRYLSGELVPVSVGLVAVKDKEGHTFSVSKDDPRYISGELVGATTGTIVAKDKEGHTFSVSKDDQRYISGELVGATSGNVTAKDKNGNYFKVSKDDKRLETGELKYIWNGRKHNKQTIEKMKQTHFENHHQQGERNSNYGNCWVMKDGQSLRVHKNELQQYLDNGWQKGRKCGNDNYINVNNGQEYKLIHKDKLQQYLDTGWQRGVGSYKYTKLKSDIKIGD